MRLRSQCLQIWLALIVLVLTPTLGAAQVADNEKAAKEREQRQQLEWKTLSLLDDVTSEVWGLRLAQNRSFIQATAADLLWTRNEKRARSLFWEALNNLALTTSVPLEEAQDPAKDPSARGSSAKTQSQDAARTQRQYFETVSARRELLRMVARHDAQLALDMMRSTRLPPPPQDNAAARLTDEKELEQEMANEAAEGDPKKALQIAPVAEPFGMAKSCSDDPESRSTLSF